MNDGTEARLAALERELAEAKKSAGLTTHAENNVSRRRRRKPAVLASIFIAVTASAAWFGYVNSFWHDQRRVELPSSVLAQADFNVYVPAGDAVEVDKSSAAYKNGAVTFVARYGSGSAVVTQQRRPSDLDMSKYINGEGMSHARQLAHPLGQLVTGEVLKRRIAVLETKDGSLVTISLTSDKQSPSVIDFVDTLVPAADN
jgi:hypothetical protein